jgi:hypothetical protein
MRPLIIEETNYTPKIQFNSDGKMSIVGKSLPEDTAKFYEPLLSWINECDLESLNLTVRLDYMNSSSAHQISKFLILAKDNPRIKNCNVDWFYESDDEDGLDFGKELEYMTDFTFNFHQYSAVEA